MSSLVLRAARPATASCRYALTRSMSTGLSAPTSQSSSSRAPPATMATIPANVDQPPSRFQQAFTSYMNPDVEPYRAPISHAPTTYPKNRSQFAATDVSRQRTAEEYIADIPIIEVDGPTAICDGGDPRLGHPIEYIQLNVVRPDKPATCKYCGLRYKQAHHH